MNRPPELPAFVPDLRPFYCIQLLTGAGHSAENPGGIPGNWVSDPVTAHAQYLAAAREGGFRRLLYKDMAGALLGQNNPASTWYTMLPQVRALFDTPFDPTIEAWLYNGTRCHPSNPDIYNLDIGPAASDAIAKPLFCEQANEPWIRKGITGIFYDASYISDPDDPSIPGRNAKVSALSSHGDRTLTRKYPRLRIGAELFSHTPSQSVPGQFDLLYPYIAQRPHLCTFQIWQSFYKDTVLTVPSNLELHVLVFPNYTQLPTPFDFTAFQLLRSRGFIVDIAHDFKGYSAGNLALWNQMVPYLIEDSKRAPINRQFKTPYGMTLTQTLRP